VLTNDEDSFRYAYFDPGQARIMAGMALFEQTAYDPQNGSRINASVADYIATVNADAPQIGVQLSDYPEGTDFVELFVEPTSRVESIKPTAH
jgi:hypothetical protein